jgi:basic membrane lipoprotein Med (substrate-binding protein (PBP1-ABC) superfamily)
MNMPFLYPDLPRPRSTHLWPGYRFLASVLLAALLAACSAPALMPTLAPATEPPTPAPPTAVPSATPTLAPTPTVAPSATLEPPTATPTPFRYGLVSASSELDSGSAAEGLVRAAQEFGWEEAPVNRDTPPEAQLRALADASPAVLVAVGDDLAQSAADRASEYPGVFVIGISLQAPASLPANMLLLGGPGSRLDQVGFLGGMAAGMVTLRKRVAVISDPNSLTGRLYRNGFIHGVRYTCPACEVDTLDISAADSETAGVEAQKLEIFGADVFAGSLTPAGRAALLQVAERGAWVIGLGVDLARTVFADPSTLGGDRVLLSITPEWGEAVYQALTQFNAGALLGGAQPLSLAGGTVRLRPSFGLEGGLTSLDQQDLEAAGARIASGDLETGIDPLTGEER